MKSSCWNCAVSREQYGRRIQEQENLGKALRDKQKYMRDHQDTSVTQMRMWRDIERLLECKRRLASDQPSDAESTRPARRTAAAANDDEDRLVLWCSPSSIFICGHVNYLE